MAGEGNGQLYLGVRTGLLGARPRTSGTGFPRLLVHRPVDTRFNRASLSARWRRRRGWDA
ncbi:hypothetical protein BN2537_1625 [Streptomyces venezuelae]|nr:hypothetical protein BN2537_1625 [Streptomyces venezuelae]